MCVYSNEINCDGSYGKETKNNKISNNSVSPRNGNKKKNKIKQERKRVKKNVRFRPKVTRKIIYSHNEWNIGTANDLLVIDSKCYCL